MEKSEIRQLSYFTPLSRDQDGMDGRRCERDDLCDRQKGNPFGWELKEEWNEEYYVVVTQFLSTSCLGPWNHTQSFTGASSIKFTGL